MKENIFNLIVQYLLKHSTVPATLPLLLHLLPDILGFETKILYSSWYCTEKYAKAQLLVEYVHM